MSNWIGQTNHKLYQVRLLLEQLAETQPKALTEALEQSAIYHLRDAYLCYLHELAELVQFHQRVDSLAQLVANVSLKTGEMQELAKLEQDSFSWLAALLTAADDSLRSREPAQVQPAGVQIIALQPTSSTQADSQVWQWYQQLAELIERQRENRQES
ncbi:hypothetical protein GCM10011297_15370 [Bacterioplanes sanyensis]|uniref:DUF6586 family protein n=1 Tax=Bacterioplanes sanyensis TaxID=1249553 RepID=UPI001679D3F2|nr:DUF6586 family protein [Bacterioplanes sanyensis]GGY43477.1 hypothetical protein GCM10011297_15370 [Bacterioplanes sanyensis]